MSTSMGKYTRDELIAALDAAEVGSVVLSETRKHVGRKEHDGLWHTVAVFGPSRGTSEDLCRAGIGFLIPASALAQYAVEVTE